MLSLSEAIRLDAMVTPQGFGSLASFASSPAHCPLGSAAAAVGIESGMSVEADEIFPILSVRVTCPIAPDCFGRGHVINADVCAVIWHLNDEHGWTRERIADWVQSIEEARAVEVSTVEAIGQ